MLDGNAEILQSVKFRGTKLLPGYWLHALVRIIVFHFIEIIQILWFSFPVALRPDSGSWPPLRGFAIILRHTTLGGTPLEEWSVRRRHLYLTTHSTHKRQTDIHAPGGIRTHSPSKRAAPNPLLRRRGHPGSVILWFSNLKLHLNTLRTRSFKLFKRPFPGFLIILTL